MYQTGPKSSFSYILLHTFIVKSCFKYNFSYNCEVF